MKWQKKITKREMKHLKDTHEGRPTLTGFKKTRIWQKEQGITCFECRHIALKLGIEQ